MTNQIFKQGDHVRIGETLYHCPTASNSGHKIKPGDTLIVRRDFDSATAPVGASILLSLPDGTGAYAAWPDELERL